MMNCRKCGMEISEKIHEELICRQCYKIMKHEIYLLHREEYIKEAKDRFQRYYREHREEILSKRKKDPRIKESQRKHFRKIKREVLSHYANPLKCACSECNETNLGFLTIDHILNNGAEERKRIKGNYLYYWLRKHNYPKGYQVLCYNCNLGRAKTPNKVCPHFILD